MCIFSFTNNLCFKFRPGEIQQHGFARNVNWTVKSMTDTSVELEMAPSDYTKEIWDKEFLCTFTVTLEDDQLATKMLVENKGEEAFDFQAALHSKLLVRLKERNFSINLSETKAKCRRKIVVQSQSLRSMIVSTRVTMIQYLRTLEQENR